MSKSRVFCMVFFSVLLACPMSWAASGCLDFSADVVLSGNPLDPYGTYTGEINVSIGDQSFEHVPETVLIGAVKLGDDGTILTVDINKLAFGDLGTLILTEHGVASPTDTPYLYRVNSRLDICVSEDAKCTGYFENAFGRISAHGYVDFSKASITGNSKGRICW